MSVTRRTARRPHCNEYVLLMLDQARWWSLTIREVWPVGVGINASATSAAAYEAADICGADR